MDDRNFDFQPQNVEEGKSKAKGFWKHVGFIVLALTLAVVTVVVLNLNI
jgi:hypothetical protein